MRVIPGSKGEVAEGCLLLSRLPGFRGINALRTCKEINTEAPQILYGENCFVLDTRFRTEHTDKTWVQDFAQEFRWYSHLLPDFPTKGGLQPSPERISSTVNGLFWFGKEVNPPEILYYDPLIRFLNEAGRKNASLITGVKIQRYFKRAPRYYMGDDRPLGLARVLPTYQTILKEVCPSLRSVVLDTMPGNSLHMAPVEYHIRQIRQWDVNGLTLNDDAPGTSQLSDENKIDLAVNKLVTGLPQLRKLQLGDYKYKIVPQRNDEWGKSVHWMNL
jgi:hypothetical protein